MVGVLYKDQPDLARAFLDDFGATWPSRRRTRTARSPRRTGSSRRRRRTSSTRTAILRGIQIGEVRPEDFDTQYAKIAP